MSDNEYSDDQIGDLLDQAQKEAYAEGRADERQEWLPVLEALKELSDLHAEAGEIDDCMPERRPARGLR